MTMRKVLVERYGKRYAFETHLPVAVGDTVLCDTAYGPMLATVAELDTTGDYDGPLKQILSIEKRGDNGGQSSGAT